MSSTDKWISTITNINTIIYQQMIVNKPENFVALRWTMLWKHISKSHVVKSNKFSASSNKINIKLWTWQNFPLEVLKNWLLVTFVYNSITNFSLEVLESWWSVTFLYNSLKPEKLQLQPLLSPQAPTRFQM